MGRWLIEKLLQAKADEEPLRCGDWSEERCGENAFHRMRGFWLFIQVLFRYEDPTKIVVRCWIGLACIPVCFSITIVAITNVSSLASTWARPLLCWRQLWRAGKTASLTPKRATWWTMLNTPVEVLFCPSPPLFHFFLRSWGLLAYFSASSGHLLHDKNSAHCN